MSPYSDPTPSPRIARFLRELEGPGIQRNDSASNIDNLQSADAADGHARHYTAGRMLVGAVVTAIAAFVAIAALQLHASNGTAVAGTASGPGTDFYYFPGQFTNAATEVEPPIVTYEHG